MLHFYVRFTIVLVLDLDGLVLREGLENFVTTENAFNTVDDGSTLVGVSFDGKSGIVTATL